MIRSYTSCISALRRHRRSSGEQVDRWVVGLDAARLLARIVSGGHTAAGAARAEAGRAWPG
jgi:hypothetical protein